MHETFTSLVCSRSPLNRGMSVDRIDGTVKQLKKALLQNEQKKLSFILDENFYIPDFLISKAFLINTIGDK